MHVYEPALLRRQKRTPKAKKVLLVCSVVIAILLSGVLLFGRNKANEVLGSNKQSIDTSSAQTMGDAKYFSGYDFQKLYETSALPNTERVTEAPTITGNQAADTRIRQIAESRGYKLEAIPKQSIIMVADIVSDDNLLQPYAREGWLQIKALAAKDNVPIQVVSGYISIEKQRQLFLSELNRTTSAETIAAGRADAAITGVLERVALPGYTRHHTGYAVDFQCNDSSHSFEASKCNKWLTDNNYARAKQVGFIPSVAEGVGTGESDEYVWVGSAKFF